MQYAAYCGQERLTQWYHTALAEHRNIVLQASSLQDPIQEFALSVAEGLASTPRRLECRFLYDAQGSALYERICAQPDYYPTRTEASILQQWAPEISATTGPCTLIELGSGSSVKTGHLLSAFQTRYGHVCYTPIDISGNALKHAGRAIIDQRPEVQVVGIHGTYSDSFPLIRSVSPALVIFLGSTIGNFTPAEERIFWSDVTGNMQHGDYFLLGVDLIKDVDLLEAAYNDRAGVTARFTKNYFARMNRELGAAIDLDAVEHKAWYNPEKEQVEIYGQFHDNLEIFIQPLNQSHDIGRGESILLEISRKFNLTGVQESLTGYGLQPVRTYTDPQGWFGLLLLEKKGQ